MNNTTVNGTFPFPFPFPFPQIPELIGSDDKVAIGFCCSLISLLGISGNSLVIYVLGWTQRGKRSGYETLLMLLAIIDFFSSVSIPTLIAYRYIATDVTSITTYRAVCTTSETLSGFGTALSEAVLLTICFERYRGIVDPHRSHIKARNIAFGLLGGVVIAVCVLIPFWIESRLFCSAGFLLTQSSTIIVAKGFVLVIHVSLVLARDLISLSVMAVLNSRMIQSLSKSEQSVESQNASGRARKFSQARRLLFVVILLFTLCVLPDSFTNFFLNVLLDRKYFQDKLQLLFRIIRASAYLKILLAANSTINPIIYSMLHPLFIPYRQRIISFLCAPFGGLEKKPLQQRTSTQETSLDKAPASA